MKRDKKSRNRVSSYILAIIVLLMITSTVQSSSDAFMSKPTITTGTEITSGDPITISSMFSGELTASDWNNLVMIVPGNRVINITFDIELYENKLGRDEKLCEKSFSHVARFSRLGGTTVELAERGSSQSANNVEIFNDLMRNLVDVPLDTLTSDKNIFVRIRVRSNLVGDWIFDPFGMGYQKETDWSRSDTIAVKVVRKPEPTLAYTASRDSINLGESITIRAEGGNIGGKANEYSTISVSFPDLRGRDDARQVSVGDNNFYKPRYYTQTISPGDKIWKFNDGGIPTTKESTAQYVVVEGGSSEGVNWDAGETHFMDVQVTPKEVGEFDIYLRVTLTSLTEAADFRQMFTNPVYSDQKDQQNFLVYHKTITVKEKPPELEVEPSDYYIDFGNVDKGNKLSKKFRINSRNQAGDTEILSWSIEEKKTLNDGGKEGISWASFSPSSGSLNKGRSADLNIEIDTNNEEIKQGHRYDATFYIASNGGGSGHQIKFYVNKPKLNTESEALDFGEVLAGKTETRELRISNIGEGKLKWEVDRSSLPGWIKLDKYSGETNGGDSSAKVKITVDTTFLPPEKRSYSTEIPVGSNGGDGIISVTFQLLKPTELSIIPESLSFELDIGEKASQEISVSNCGSGTLIWNARSDNPSWLDISYPQEDTISVTVDAQSLEPGQHEGHITIDSNGGQKTATISVDIPILPEPNFDTSPDEISNFVTIPKGQTESWHFYIENYNDITLDWSIDSGYPYTSWLTADPRLGSTGVDSSDQVNVTVDASDLEPGRYVGHIAINAEDAGVKMGTVTLDVTSDVPLPPKLYTNPDSISHDFGEISEGQKKSWDFMIFNCEYAGLHWSISSDNPSWLEVNPSKGSTARSFDTITITVDTTSLDPGDHVGYVTIESNGGTKTGKIAVVVPPKPDIPSPLVVCPSGCDFSSIQDAINVSNPGGIIEVQSGSYKENLHLDKSLTFRGVDTGEGKPVVEVEPERCVIDSPTEGVLIEGLILKTGYSSKNKPESTADITVGSIDCDYTSIQEAIDAAKPGDVIEVQSGTYFENLNVDKQLTLHGADIGGGIPVVDGRNGKTGIALLSDGINLENFNVINSVTGIKISSSNNIVRDNTVHDNTCGIYIESSDNYIANNYVYSNLVGVTVPQSCNDIITNNDIADNSMKVVYLED